MFGNGKEISLLFWVMCVYQTDGAQIVIVITLYRVGPFPLLVYFLRGRPRRAYGAEAETFRPACTSRSRRFGETLRGDGDHGIRMGASRSAHRVSRIRRLGAPCDLRGASGS